LNIEWVANYPSVSCMHRVSGVFLENKHRIRSKCVMDGSIYAMVWSRYRHGLVIYLERKQLLSPSGAWANLALDFACRSENANITDDAFNSIIAVILLDVAVKKGAIRSVVIFENRTNLSSSYETMMT
jgi:hypothetical protein